MKYLFIDESGDHNLDPKKIDPQFPYLVLTGVVFDSKTYKNFGKKLLELKKQQFGKKTVLLHSKELTRPNRTKQKELKVLTNPEKRAVFYKEINKLIDESNFETIIFKIDKKKVSKKIGPIPIDLYFLGFTNVFNKFKAGLKNKEHGKTFIESRNKNLDKQFILTWRNTKITKIYKQLEPKITPKSWKQSGLELADLISYRVSRKILKKPTKPVGNEINIKTILKKKFYFEEFLKGKGRSASALLP